METWSPGSPKEQGEGAGQAEGLQCRDQRQQRVGRARWKETAASPLLQKGHAGGVPLGQDGGSRGLGPGEEAERGHGGRDKQLHPGAGKGSWPGGVWGEEALGSSWGTGWVLPGCLGPPTSQGSRGCKGRHMEGGTPEGSGCAPGNTSAPGKGNLGRNDRRAPAKAEEGARTLTGRGLGVRTKFNRVSRGWRGQGPPADS